MIVFLTSRYLGYEARFGPSPFKSTFWDTCPEPYELVSTDDADLDARVAAIPPGSIVVWDPSPKGPSLEALQALRQHSKLVALWADSHIAYDVPSDFQISADGPTFWFRPTPRAAAFCDAGLERDIDVFFSGDLNGERQAVEALKSLPIRCEIRSGWWDEKRLTEAEYINRLQRAKIVVNFSRTRNWPEGYQFKGRVTEATLCGAMLLESHNPLTRQWLTPDLDFVEFGDLPALVMHYLERDDERRQVAEMGKVRMQEITAGWWPELLRAIS